MKVKTFTSNYLQKFDIKSVEKVQKHLISLIPGLSGTYEDKLQLLALQTLEERRERSDMVATFQIMKDVDHVDCNTWSSTYGDDTDIRRHFFITNRVVNFWNSLLTELKECRTVYSSKGGMMPFSDSSHSTLYTPVRRMKTN